MTAPFHERTTIDTERLSLINRLGEHASRLVDLLGGSEEAGRPGIVADLGSRAAQFVKGTLTFDKSRQNSWPE